MHFHVITGSPRGRPCARGHSYGLVQDKDVYPSSLPGPPYPFLSVRSRLLLPLTLVARLSFVFFSLFPSCTSSDPFCFSRDWSRFSSLFYLLFINYSNLLLFYSNYLAVFTCVRSLPLFIFSLMLRSVIPFMSSFFFLFSNYSSSFFPLAFA